MPLVLRKDLYKPPVLRSHIDASRDRHASWLELLYDLIYVAALAQLAAVLTKDFTLTGLGTFCILFIPLWWSWVGHTYYMTRFDSDDIVHRALSFLQMGAVAAMAYFIPKGVEAGATGFAISYVIVRAILVVEYIRAGHSLPQARSLIRAYAIGFTLAILIWIASIFVPSPWHLVLWAAAILVDIGTPLYKRSLGMRFPPNVTHLPERYGLFTIIVLGEAIASTVLGVSSAKLGPWPAITAMLSLLIAFAFWWGYFFGAGAAEARGLTPGNQKRFQIWMYAHLPLTASLTIVAVGAKLLIKVDANHSFGAGPAWMLSASLALCMALLSVIGMTSLQFKLSTETAKFFIPHWILNGITLLTGFAAPYLSGPGFMALLAGLSVCQILLSMRESTIKDVQIDVESLLDENEHVPKTKNRMIV